MMRQCRLTKGRLEKIAWIPIQFAEVGKIIDLNDEGWSLGWTVQQTYTTLPTEYVREHERDYKSQRKASDI